jgi:phosphoribosyl-AMP cyclohydrolase
MTVDDLRFDAQGLIPAVVQEGDTGDVLMVAWMDRAAVTATLETGFTHFWSRSRQTSWRKGETSGHVQHVQRVYTDCDADALLVQVHQEGPACHTNTPTCFFAATLKGDGAPTPTMLARIEQIVEARKTLPPEGS